MNAAHIMEITKNNSTVCLATEGKFCDRNIAVTANIDTAAIQDEAWNGGFEVGKTQGEKESWDSFWDAYQNYGNRTDYERAFRGEGWNGVSYNPKYIPKPVNGAYMYQNSQIEGRLLVDTSQCTNMDAMFGVAKRITSISTIDTRNVAQLAGIFGYMDKLENIDLLILKDDGSQTFTDSCFIGDFSLKEIRIQGKIGNSLKLICQSLSKESITSVIGALSDDVSGKTLTLSQWVRDDLTDAEWSALTGAKQNWTIAFV